MRKLGFILLLFITQNLLAQSSDQHELAVTIQSAHYDFDMFRANDVKFGPDDDNLEILHNIYVWVIIDGFDEDNPIDFNNFSLVETELKLRQRPDNVGFRQFYLQKVDLKEFHGEDTFLKYTQSGITNNDHYYRVKNPWKKTITQQQRFYPIRIPLKKNKKKEFYLNFPVKNENKGEFSLYYKDKLIKTFFMERGDNLKF